MSELTYTTPTALLNAICSAVREKDGTTDAIAYQDLPQRVLDIPSEEVSNKLYLYKNGNAYVDITGGYSCWKWNFNSDHPGNINSTFSSSDNIKATFTNAESKYSSGFVGTNNLINLRGYDYINFSIASATIPDGGASGDYGVHIGIYLMSAKSSGTDYATNYVITGNNNAILVNPSGNRSSVSITNQTISIDVSSIDEAYINIVTMIDAMVYSTITYEIDEIWLEKKQTPSKLYLYNDGDECTDVTGGWEFNSRYNISVLTKKDNCMQIDIKGYSPNYENENVYLDTKNEIQMEKYTKLVFEYDMKNFSNGAYIFGLHNTKASQSFAKISTLLTNNTIDNSRLIYYLDLGENEYNKYVTFFSYASSGNPIINIYKVWLE